MKEQIDILQVSLGRPCRIHNGYSTFYKVFLKCLLNTFRGGQVNLSKIANSNWKDPYNQLNEILSRNGVAVGVFKVMP